MRLWRLVTIGIALSASSVTTQDASPVAGRNASSASTAERYPLIPWPTQLQPADGEFSIIATTRIVIGDVALRPIAAVLADAIGETSATPDIVTSGASSDAHNTIVLRLDTSASATTAGSEAYHLVVTPERITLTAAAPAGLFYGVQTLRQLLPVHGDDASVSAPPASATPARPTPARATPTQTTIPAVTIRDAPRFPYRGMHLDVARHFFPVSFIKRYIDLLASYKLNTFHWHLTDDQGWRIEIERYPRLTEVGAFRDETVVAHAGWDVPLQFDGQRYGGYYTQDEIRDVVAYATSRHITIIPEIELPGHSVAALAAYPELACTPGPFDVLTKWGVSEDIYCPHEATFEFLENVLTEVMALFPGEYIHIGGDEAPKRRWEESDVAQAVMRREGLADEHELQSWFIRRIEAFLNANGRKLIGWDEIMEGGLSSTATMMFWRDWATVPVGPDSTPVSAAKVAAGRGNDIIMTPNRTLYFDHWQADPLGEPLSIGGYSPLRKVYAYEPVPDDFTSAEAQHVLGAQANVWTEYITTTDHAEYMVLPRMLALAEVVWSPKDARDWASFTRRLSPHFARFEADGINYRRPDAAILAVAPPAASPLPPRIIGYLAAWTVRTKNLRIASIAGDRLTHIFYAFGRVTEDGTAALGDPCLDTGACEPDAPWTLQPAQTQQPPQALQPGAQAVPTVGGNFAELRALKERFPHLKLFISLGGQGGSQWFSDAASTADGRARLVASTIDVFLRQHPGLFDGIDVDWEYPVAGGLEGTRHRPEDGRNLTLLMEEYRRQLDALQASDGASDGRTYALSIAASPRPDEIANLELPRLARTLDFINVMAFDYHTDSLAHFNAPLYAAAADPAPSLNVATSMQTFLDAGVPAHQLVVGAPFFARGFGNVAADNDGLLQSGDPEAAGEYRTIDWRALVRRRPADHGFERHWSADALVPWLYNPETRVFITYDGPDGLRAKAHYVRANGFGGMMFWELGGDDGTLLQVIDEALHATP